MTTQQGVNVVLAVLVVLTAIWLVHTQYEARRLFAAVEDAKREEAALARAYDKLEVQKRVQAAPDRVKRLALGRLGMREPTSAQTEYVRVPVVVAPAALTEGARK